ncbi:MAG: hypothetical protein M0C28_25500 [Candidatus Moduliflexus flocculans]|nr:hypothetical protein [Candidatus Moduliflexus flocculans]
MQGRVLDAPARGRAHGHLPPSRSDPEPDVRQAEGTRPGDRRGRSPRRRRRT